MPAHRFELAGGHPVLDFLNTIQDWTADEPVDYLVDFADAVRFGQAAGVLTRGEAAALRPDGGRAELARLRRLRALLERIFRRLVLGRAPASADLDRLSLALARAARLTRLRGATGSPVRPRLDLALARAEVLRLRLAQAAGTLLTSPEVRRLKACPACGWFFLDASKNGSRRWCSMDTCGASAKAKRYYRRKRGSRPVSKPGAPERLPRIHSSSTTIRRGP
jgi:predicted RNA-binding Zn ribbon-like protein